MTTDKCRREFRRSILEQRIQEILQKKREKLDDETQVMLFKAKEAARMQMQIEKQQSKLKNHSSNVIEDLVSKKN